MCNPFDVYHEPRQYQRMLKIAQVDDWLGSWIRRRDVHVTAAERVDWRWADGEEIARCTVRACRVSDTRACALWDRIAT